MAFGYHLRKIDGASLLKFTKRKVKSWTGEKFNPAGPLKQLKDLFDVNWLPLKTLIPSFNDPGKPSPKQNPG